MYFRQKFGENINENVQLTEVGLGVEIVAVVVGEVDEHGGVEVAVERHPRI
jgi:hypothetical protein